MTTDDKKIIFSLIGVGKVIPPNRQVIKDISLSFFYGAKIGVLGLNGAGKSTVLRIIAGLDSDFTGERIISPAIASATCPRSHWSTARKRFAR
jgi:sulfate-transporting ATPase